QAVVQAARETERDEAPAGKAAVPGEADQRGRQTRLPRRPLLRRGGAGERQPVSVQAMLRTVCFRLLVASNAADGSKPEWIAQCSQRSSLPGPYSSHSIPSSSAS